jgi:hypothetical protein
LHSGELSKTILLKEIGVLDTGVNTREEEERWPTQARCCVQSHDILYKMSPDIFTLPHERSKHTDRCHGKTMEVREQGGWPGLLSCGYSHTSGCTTLLTAPRSTLSCWRRTEQSPAAARRIVSRPCKKKARMGHPQHRWRQQTSKAGHPTAGDVLLKKVSRLRSKVTFRGAGRSFIISGSLEGLGGTLPKAAFERTLRGNRSQASPCHCPCYS